MHRVFREVVFSLAAMVWANVFAVTGLAVDHLREPGDVGPTPSFCWQMDSDRQGAAQTAYRIRVLDGAADGGVVWDSGVVEDGASVGIRYAGAPLKDAHRYAWRVDVKDELGGWSPSAPAFFTTGLQGDDGWRGSKWISAADAKVLDPPSEQNDGNKNTEAADGTSCFVKSVPNGREVKEVWLAVTGLGVFDAYVNGKPVSRRLSGGALERDFLKPGFTHYGKTRHSFTYDVTHLARTGAADVNVIAAEVSAGWWRDKIVNFHGKRSAFRAVLILRHADGTESRVGTDESWLSATAGPVLRAAIFDGEDYDARISSAWMDGKSTAGFKPSEENDEFSGSILPMEGPGTTLRRDLALAPVGMYVWKDVVGASEANFGKVVKLRSMSDGDDISISEGETLVVDFGQNAAAVPEFEFSAAAGTTLVMHPAEMLNDGNGAKSRGCDGPEGSIYTTNYRRARTTFSYTFAGNGVERYHPRFTFFGYRYASITASGKVLISKMRSLPVTSVRKDAETGSLKTGDADVNRLISNSLWGQYSNYLSVPTDCPQRNERLGWTADTQVFAHAGAFNADTYGFLRKWMRDMRDTQHDDGSYPGVAPIAQYGDLGHQVGWADAGIIVPYVMWRQFGDVRIILENWESMKRYMALVDGMRYESPESRAHQWADWLSYEKLESAGGGAFETGPDGKRRPKLEALAYWQYLGCCYWLWDARMMVEMARAARLDSDVGPFEAMSSRALEFLRTRFVAQDGLLIPVFRGMQTPALFALKLGLLADADAVAATKADLIRGIKDHGSCLQTGFLGTSILMDTLTYDAGSPELAYTLLLQHNHPSWLYTVDQGATTFWERWNSYTKARGFGPAGMNSFNHYAYGAVVAWMYGTMAGIRAGEDGGFRHFTLAPVPDRRIGSLDASYRSPYGTIRSSWRYGPDGKCVWRFTVPANTTAAVKLPGGAVENLAAGSYVRSL